MNTLGLWGVKNRVWWCVWVNSLQFFSLSHHAMRVSLLLLPLLLLSAAAPLHASKADGLLDVFIVPHSHCDVGV